MFRYKVVYPAMVNFPPECVLRTSLNVAFFYNFLTVHALPLATISGFVASNLTKREYKNATDYQNTNLAWRDLTIVAEEMFKFQNDLQPRQNQPSQSRIVLVLCNSFTQQAASDFVGSISNIHANVQFICYQILNADDLVENELLEIVGILINNRGTINNVVMFLDNATAILKIFETASSKEALKFTAVHHVAEWIIVARHFPNLISQIQDRNFVIDFISVICKEANNTILIAQKSRDGNLSVKARMLIDPVKLQISVQEAYKTVIKCLNSLAARNIVRKSGDLYLKSKKSVLAGLHVPVAMASLELQDWDLRFNSNKLSNHENYAVELLDYLATHLDFTYNIALTNDSGYFGMVNNGSATGLAGQLARREAALTTMPMAPISNRLDVMDFVPVQLLSDLIYIVYRLPQPKNHVDMTYIKIFRPEFIYIHIAPVVLILLFRAGIRVYTQFWAPGCVPSNVCSWKSRNLLSFLGYISFRETNIPSWHFERILVASWHVFVFIMWSAYSAYLVTSFVAKPRELTIRSFKELDNNKNFKVGALTTLAPTINTMQTSENVHVKAVWERLQSLNKSDPLTLSPNVSVHVHRIVAGDYVYIGGINMFVTDNYRNILLNYTDIQYCIAMDFTFKYTSFLGIANEVFYKETLLKFLHLLDENGTLRRLNYKHFNKGFVDLSDNVKIREEHKSVTLKRIELLLFLTLGGILLSTFGLMCEYILQRWMTYISLKD